ncbi:GNAT family acetyltransferase [Microvirga ossetica]|uniref:GNAT family acetyltransferase n=1 Tax=Microvirga ossetica TaxID=1882682 RepID=A0A1B2ED49_9HYPH|nr:GNAT family N-acetyltransferase [Microvirga ossetica]ANY77849.1 GNAT family acetyltransferase [Microvirga ossetica]
MNAQQALHPPDAADSGDIVIRAARPIDCEGIAALGNMPGYRWGTLRVPYQTPEAARKWLETMAPGNISLVVEKDGRGIGTRLLRELIEIADDWLNLRRIELTVYVDNARAIALYERHGFEIEGTHRDYAFRGGAFVDAYAMARVKA